MSGCNQKCEQGRTCVCNVATTRPAWMNGAAEVATYHLRTCDELGVCQGRGDCQHAASGEGARLSLGEYVWDAEERADGIVIFGRVIGALAFIALVVATVWIWVKI